MLTTSTISRFVWSPIAATALLVAMASPALAKGDDDFDATAMKSIERLSDFTAKAKQFSVTIDAAYDIVQDWGQKLEFGETRTLTLRRPDRFKVEATDRNGAVSGVVFDGREIAAFDLKDKVYATMPQPGSIDDAVTRIVDDLGMRLPMAAIFQGRLAKDVKSWAREVRYVEESTIAGVTCDHVVLHGDWEDVQLWIARGDQPLLQRIVITYHRAEGKPQFSAQFRNWTLNPDASDAVFAFTPATGATKIAFVPRREIPGTVSASTGDKP
jgi:hypothetical protein